MGFWIRTGSVTFVNSQFSDNSVGAMYPTSDCPGNIQLMHKAVFVGFTENVGSPGPTQSIFKPTGLLLKFHDPTRNFIEGGFGGNLGWLRLADGVVRSSSDRENFPRRGFNTYDNYAATFLYDTHFYDYPNEFERSNSGKKWYGGGISVKLNNNAGMVATPSKMWNLSFTNVARRATFGTAPAPARDFNPLQYQKFEYTRTYSALK